MDFMTIKQASEKWGICTRRVQTLCTEGRIDGAERLGHQWVIPINAEKPKDARIKSGRYIKTKSGNGENEDGKKTVQLLSEGKSFADIKKLNEETNIYGAPTKLRAQQIYSTVTARIKTLDESFYPIFLSSDLATQKLFVLTAALLHDTLFFDFVYEVVREKMILGSDELTDADIRIFFKNKQEQSEKVASLQDYTLRRLGSCYKTQLYEAGLLESNRANSTRKILKPILDIAFEHWLYDHDLGIMVKTLTGVR